MGNMKNRAIIFIAILALALSALAPAYAEQADAPRAERTVAISAEFDPRQWTFGDEKWFSPLDLKLDGFAESEAVTVAKLHGDIHVSRAVVVAEFDREFQMDEVYIKKQYGWLLTQVAFATEFDGDADYQSAIDVAEKLYKRFAADGDDLAIGRTPPIFDEMRAGTTESGQKTWTSAKPIAKFKGVGLLGYVELEYSNKDGARTLKCTFGATSPGCRIE